ncbi:MAG: 50S ribosomal protein L25 [Chloroflexota bacterium]|nr:MAG: 50S ribosomal protein L25 [Chloroflexota bacterium]
MAERFTLSLEPRTVLGKKVKALRRRGIMPATVYGRGVEPIAVQVDARVFNDLYRKAGRTSVVDLQIPGQRPLSAFIHMLQRHPVTREILHADFRVVDLRTELVVAVPVQVTGESPLVARGDAIINLVHSTLNVRALPTDVPSAITVDISGLDSFDKNIHVRDIELPEKVTIELDPDEMVVTLTAARVVAEEEAEAEAPAEEEAAEPELVREREEEESEE